MKGKPNYHFSSIRGGGPPPGGMGYPSDPRGPEGIGEFDIPGIGGMGGNPPPGKGMGKLAGKPPGGGGMFPAPGGMLGSPPGGGKPPVGGVPVAPGNGGGKGRPWAPGAVHGEGN